MDKKIRSTKDLPPDDIQTDPLRRLINVWRRRGSFEEADELCALLNEIERVPRPNVNSPEFLASQRKLAQRIVNGELI